MNIKKPLPRGISSIRKILEDGYLYIDKTKLIHSLITTEKYAFLSRPRRFGKSLLISTLKEIFLGNKELFKGLWIHDQVNQYQWPQYPVIHLDLSFIDCHRPENLSIGLNKALDTAAESYNINLSSSHEPGYKLMDLVRELSKKNRVVILIDEYDAPITTTIYNRELANSNRRTLRSFYATIKSLDEYIHFFFMTGVSKFSQTSLFSGLNNLSDISFYPSAAALTGYTQEEVDYYLLPYIDEMASTRSVNRTLILNEMREWYNGYHFSKATTSVYNPFSIFQYLFTKERANYWFSSGTPTFLIDLLKEKNYNLSDLNHITASASSLNSFDIDHISIVTLLYQTGYLTLESYSDATDRYKLMYPNKEVEFSLGSHLLGVSLHKDSECINNVIEDMRNALLEVDFESFTAHLKAIFASLPYFINEQKEPYFHSILQVIGTLLGFDVQSEVITSNGRIDMVIQMPHAIFIIEIKLNKSALEALNQIKKMRYAEKYLASEKRVILIGMNFCFPNKELSIEWTSEAI